MDDLAVYGNTAEHFQHLRLCLVRQKLGLLGLGEKHFDIAPAGVLQKYFAKYLTTAKAYRTKETLSAFFREVAKFILEVGCVHVNAYRMPKQKARVIIETFEGKAVDWGVITGPALREGLHTYQTGHSAVPDGTISSAWTPGPYT